MRGNLLRSGSTVVSDSGGGGTRGRANGLDGVSPDRIQTGTAEPCIPIEIREEDPAESFSAGAADGRDGRPEAFDFRRYTSTAKSGFAWVYT